MVVMTHPYKPPRPPRLDPSVTIALVAPRNMRFSPASATSIDLHIHETARWSRFSDNIVVFAEEVEAPFADVRTRFWPKGRSKGHLERLLREAAPSLIVAHQHLPTASRLAAKFRDVPVALVRHNFQNPPRNLISGFWKRISLNRLAAIAFVSERCRESFEAYWPGLKPPVHVTPNGVDSRLWQADCEKQPILLFVGRMAPEKGVLEAALGVEAALAPRPDWRAAFVLAANGDGDPYAHAVNQVLGRLGSRVDVVLDAKHAEVRDWMARSAIAVAPTQGEESFGRVAVEAMASGTAVVVSRASGFVEVVGEAGVLLDQPEPREIARSLGELMDDPVRRDALSRAGRRRVEERYDLRRSVMAFDRMAEALLARAGVLAPPAETTPID